MIIFIITLFNSKIIRYLIYIFMFIGMVQHGSARQLMELRLKGNLDLLFLLITTALFVLFKTIRMNAKEGGCLIKYRYV